jgi:hypothetical protein
MNLFLELELNSDQNWNWIFFVWKLGVNRKLTVRLQIRLLGIGTETRSETRSETRFAFQNQNLIYIVC